MGKSFNLKKADEQMCKSFNLKKASYESSTVAQIDERFEPNTVLWTFDTIHTI